MSEPRRHKREKSDHVGRQHGFDADARDVYAGRANARMILGEDGSATTRELGDSCQSARKIDPRSASKADDYAEHVLQPLNETIQRFSRALMTWSDLGDHLQGRASRHTRRAPAQRCSHRARWLDISLRYQPQPLFQ